jgi:RNA polymerase sigma-70 factor (ECF subfamily)
MNSPWSLAMESKASGPRTPSILEQISTRWPLIRDPGKFVLRYARAIQRYLGAILRDPHAVEDVTQELLSRLLERQIAEDQIQRGRFRDYLKTVVRNAALTYLRREQARPMMTSEPLPYLADREDEPGAQVERTWNEQWRECLLDRVWDDLDSHERENPASRCYTVLRLFTEYSDREDSPEMAARLSQRVGETIRPDAFRKQLSRARRLFALYLLHEVAQTLEHPTIEAIEEELCDLELLDDMLPFLPPDWRERPDLLEE